MLKFNLCVLLALVLRVGGRELWVQAEELGPLAWRGVPAGLNSTNSLRACGSGQTIKIEW